MMYFGWKKKAEILRVTIVSAGHQTAKELPPGIVRVLDIFRQIAESGVGLGMQEAMEAVPEDVEKPLWEPADIYGWHFQATLYRKDGQLWWLVRAVRKNERAPSDKDLVLLDKVLDHLGAVPRRHAIIEPLSTPAGEERLFFGWWTWQNRWPLLDVQLKGKGSKAEMRIVPLGTRANDGFESLKMTDPDEEAGEGKP